MLGPTRWVTALLSRATGVLARLPMPRPLRRPVLGGVARVLGMDLSEAALPVSEYRSVSELFTRPLRPGVRSWPDPPDHAGSPVDGVVGASGRLEEGRLLQAKGRPYSLAELLGDEDDAGAFAGGRYVTLYLSPRHYHRVHAPLAGGVTRARHIPGRLLPVNAPATRRVDRLFPRNERLVCLLTGTRLGDVAMVAVGAFNVGRITATFEPGLVTNRRGAVAGDRTYRPPVPVGRGDELMAFHLGSTVVLVFQAGVELLVPEPGTGIRLGQAIAREPDG